MHPLFILYLKGGLFYERRIDMKSEDREIINEMCRLIRDQNNKLEDIMIAIVTSQAVIWITLCLIMVCI